jgi:hypothetical protein
MKVGKSVVALFLATMTLVVNAQSAAAKTFVIYGATGNIGQLIVKEALNRGHTVIGVARDPSKVQFDSKLYKAVAGDVGDVESFKTITKGADAVIISVSGSGDGKDPKTAAPALAAATAVQAFTGVPNSPPVVQVGGATTIQYKRDEIESHLAAPGTPMYTRSWGNLVALDTYRASKIRWSVVNPPTTFEGYRGGGPGLVRTGKYRTSTDGLVTNAEGKTVLNVADLAVAVVDEAENQRFNGKQFSVGY